MPFKLLSLEACYQGLLILLVSVSVESSVVVSLFLSSSCYSTVMYLFREIYHSILLGENVHRLVLPFKSYTHYR